MCFCFYYEEYYLENCNVISVLRKNVNHMVSDFLSKILGKLLFFGFLVIFEISNFFDSNFLGIFWTLKTRAITPKLLRIPAEHV